MLMSKQSPKSLDAGFVFIRYQMYYFVKSLPNTSNCILENAEIVARFILQ